jgi:hypothetical protein
MVPFGAAWQRLVQPVAVFHLRPTGVTRVSKFTWHCSGHLGDKRQGVVAGLALKVDATTSSVKAAPLRLPHPPPPAVLRLD